MPGGLSILQALNGLDFEIRRRKTLARSARPDPARPRSDGSFVGLIPSTTGTVTLFDHDIPSTTGQAGLAALRARLQFVFQDLTPRFNPRVWIGWDC